MSGVDVSPDQTIPAAGNLQARQARSPARLGREPQRNIQEYLSAGCADQPKPAAGIDGRKP